VKVLQTERLTLRPFVADDLDDLVELDSDPDVMHFINGGVATPPDEVEREVLPHFLAYADGASGYGFWAAEERATGAFLGWFHLRPHLGEGKPDEPELGYRLRRPAWGRGYASEGSRALVDLAFTDLGASRVYAETMAVNLASRRVMEKAGLRFVRLFHADWPVRIPGDEEGDVEYALTRDEWVRDRGVS
jgi:RimJ/RimL family protein N-acetyltransferase